MSFPSRLSSTQLLFRALSFRYYATSHNGERRVLGNHTGANEKHRKRWDPAKFIAEIEQDALHLINSGRPYSSLSPLDQCTVNVYNQMTLYARDKLSQFPLRSMQMKKETPITLRNMRFILFPPLSLTRRVTILSGQLLRVLQRQ